MQTATVPAPSFVIDPCSGFTDSRAAIEAMDAYARRLSVTASRRRLRGEDVSDQSLPVELFALRPPGTAVPPLVLLGGMGPLAGANGFRRACAIFGESREIVLLQACSVPDRTRAVLADARFRSGVSPEHVAVVRALDAALREAIRHVSPPGRAIDVIVLCNAAHAFLPEVLGRMTSGDVRLISLAERVVDALARRPGPALILSTTATRLSRIFTRRLDETGVRYVEPSDPIQEELMRAIYAGVKALDWKTAAAAGEAVFTGTFATSPDVRCVVAGCTEIPPLLELLGRTGSRELRERLARIEILDPVELAFNALADGGKSA
ncbi:MAG TPA: aspartate/glutamate racemase family protein [Thermoanaerobaculia bacterium]|nr:aspartate/glutamate racemase family protein [Thermoanaerobaculia bacterium]